VVRLLPAAREVRRAWPRARLAWLVEPPSADLLRAQEFLDEVLVFPRPQLARQLRRLDLRGLVAELGCWLRELRGRRFDLVLDFHGILKSGLLARATGAPLRVGYAPPFGREGSWLFATRRLHVEPAHLSRFERNEGLLLGLGLAPAPPAAPALRVPPDALERVRAALGPLPPFALLHPGTSPGTPHKRYPAAGLGSVARLLAREPGLASLVSYGPGERPLAEAVVAASGGTARLAPATAGLCELAALCALARLYVGPDTGPMHIASLVGTPVVQLLGPTDPVENRPWPATPTRTVRGPVGCSPCRRGCAAALCMRVIAPADVAASARALLAGAGAGW